LTEPSRRWITVAYAVFTGYAAVAAGLSGGRDRVWAIWAVCGYGIATLLLWRRRGWAAPLTVSVLLALVAPLLWNSVAFPLEDGINVINRSAVLLVHHGSPYLPADQINGYLSYNPYLPVMALAGLPYAAGLRGLAGNSGVWLAAGTIVVLAAAFWTATPAGPERRRLALIGTGLAVASPVIALNLAVITTDPPVLAFMLLSLALAATWGESRRVVPPAVALAAACVLKDTAWLAIPVMIVLFWYRDGRRAAARFTVTLLAAGLVLIVLLAPATLIHPAATKAMIRDTVLFPLGLTKIKTPAESMLPGHLLTELGTAGHVLSVGLLFTAVIAVAVSLVVRPPRDIRAAAWRMAIGLTLMFALGPQVRFGYFLYPLGLAGWIFITPALTSDPAGDGAERADRGAEREEAGQPDQARR
jgi:hypothetical protein